MAAGREEGGGGRLQGRKQSDCERVKKGPSKIRQVVCQGNGARPYFAIIPHIYHQYYQF